MAEDKGIRRKIIVILLVYINLSLTVSQNVKGDPNKQRCSRPSDWILQAENVCYGWGKLLKGQSSMGDFEIRGNHTLFALRLVHVSGALTCAYHPESRWGCRYPPCNSDCFSTFVDAPGLGIMNKKRPNGKRLYTYHGFTIDDDVLRIKFPGRPIFVKDGEIFQIKSSRFYNDNGIHCVDVEASFLD